jgi:DNA-binding MarR family transcriptional regulator
MEMRSKADTLVSAVDTTFSLSDFLPHRLAVAARGISSAFANTCLQQAGVSIPEWRLLATVGRIGTASPTIIGKQADMDKVKTSRASAALVARGFLRTMKDTSDGRGRQLSLTKKGVALHNDVMKLSSEFRDELTTLLSKQETNKLNRLLSKILDYADRLTSEEHNLDECPNTTPESEVHTSRKSSK